MEKPFYSVRMRSECDGRHHSGAERLGYVEELSSLSASLVERAMAHEHGVPDCVHCTIELVQDEALCLGRLPDVSTWLVEEARAGRCLAATLLSKAGVAPKAVTSAIDFLSVGPAPGGLVMRGAMIIDAATGERLEQDPARGVRVSRVDLAPGARNEILTRLQDAGLGHHRVNEALVLAAKVMHAPGIVAELCWSDDPNYLTGYVASPAGGYQRISKLKSCGDPFGGRAFFVYRKAWNRDAFVAYLERRAVLFNEIGVLGNAEPWQEQS
jgi:6-carboxyhexanoate--CoA ligase